MKTDMPFSMRQRDAKYMIWGGDKKAALYTLVNLPHGSMSRRYPASQDLASAWKSPDWYIPATPSAFHPLRIENKWFLHWQVQIPIEMWVWKTNHHIKHASCLIRPEMKPFSKSRVFVQTRFSDTKSGFVKPWNHPWRQIYCIQDVGKRRKSVSGNSRYFFYQSTTYGLTIKTLKKLDMHKFDNLIKFVLLNIIAFVYIWFWSNLTLICIAARPCASDLMDGRDWFVPSSGTTCTHITHLRTLEPLTRYVKLRVAHLSQGTWTEIIWEQEHDRCFSLKNISDRLGLKKRLHTPLIDSKGPMIDVDQISIRKLRVGSISFPYRFKSLCYLGCHRTVCYNPDVLSTRKALILGEYISFYK